MGESFPMKGGDGAYSYSKNSQIQRAWSDSMKGMIEDAVIHKLDKVISNTVTIADFGCSIGPNTFSTVQNLIQSVQHKFRDDLIEFQVFFNDHNANDFNTLFASLPPGRHYYAAGVPGSFHGRLFPCASITLAHSAYALHWLSMQPGGVPNEGRIYYSGASEDVARAYSDQFERDLGVFMSARAEEIVSGGLMFLVMPGTPDSDGVSHSDLCALFDFLGDCLMDLVNQGVVEKSAVDSFNLPMYFPKRGEMREVIEKNGCFRIERLELMNPSWSNSKHDDDDQGRNNNIVLIKHLRAVLDGVLTAHFGGYVVDKMFENVAAKAKDEEISGSCLEVPFNKSTQLFVVLKRK